MKRIMYVLQNEDGSFYWKSDGVSSMNGIYTTSVCESTIDEAPMAYKRMDEIIECIEPTAHIVDIIKPIYNFKAK